MGSNFKTGIKIKENWTKLANDYNLDIEINGISALPSFNFKSKNNLAYKNFNNTRNAKKRIFSFKFNLCMY